MSIIPAKNRYIHQLSAMRYSLVAYNVTIRRHDAEVMNHVFDLAIIDTISTNNITVITIIVFAPLSKRIASMRSAMNERMNIAFELYLAASVFLRQIKRQAAPVSATMAIVILDEISAEDGMRKGLVMSAKAVRAVVTVRSIEAVTGAVFFFMKQAV